MKKIKVSNLTYFIILLTISAVGIVSKSILLNSYIISENMHHPDFIKSIQETWMFWIFYLAFVVLVLSFSLLFKREKVRIFYIYIVDILITCLIICDLLYGRSFSTMPSIVNVSMMFAFTGVDSSEIFSLLSGYDLLFFCDFILLTLFLVFVKEPEIKSEKHKKIYYKRLKIANLAAILISVIILTSIPVNASFQNNIGVEDSIYNTDNELEQALYYSSLGYHIEDIYEVCKEKLVSQYSHEDTQLKEAYYNWKNEELPENEYKGMFKGKNLIFIQVESLESFMLNKSINGTEITPNLNKLIKNGLTFTNIEEQVRCGNSSDADLMYTTSRLPIEKGCTFYRCSDDKLVSLPRLLDSVGYQSSYYQAIDAKFWNYKEALTNIVGFDEFNGSESYDMSDILGITLSDASFFRQTNEMLKTKKTPFYAHIVCNSNHMPFEIEDSLKNLNLGEDLENSYMGNYLNCVSYVDEYIGKFLEDLENEGILDDTVIIIAGDHAGIHKYYNYSLEQYYSEYEWFDTQGKSEVPFILYSKDIKEAKQFDTIGGQIDLMPTICYIMGIEEEQYEGVAMGRNLLNTNRSYALSPSGEIIGNVDDQGEYVLSNAYNISEKLFSINK